MRSYVVRPLFAACMFVFVPLTLTAQDEPSIGARGGLAIVVHASTTTVVGLDFRVGERTDLVLETALGFLDENDEGSRSVTLRPALKRYMGPLEADVAPYLFIGATAGWSEVEILASDRTRSELGATIGVGVDWLPVQRVTIGGHVGVSLQHVRAERPTGAFPPQFTTVSGVNVTTMTSSLRVQLSL